MWLSINPVLWWSTPTRDIEMLYLSPTKQRNTYGITSFYVWASLYAGYPKHTRLDQEKVFLAEFFRSAAEIQCIELQFSGVKSHNEIGSGETYHHLLRRIFLKLRILHSSDDDEFILRLYIKAINYTAGHSRLLTSMLVFVIPPAVLGLNRDHPAHAERM